MAVSGTAVEIPIAEMVSRLATSCFKLPMLVMHGPYETSLHLMQGTREMGCGVKGSGSLKRRVFGKTITPKPLNRKP